MIERQKRQIQLPRKGYVECIRAWKTKRYGDIHGFVYQNLIERDEIQEAKRAKVSNRGSGGQHVLAES